MIDIPYTIYLAACMAAGLYMGVMLIRHPQQVKQFFVDTFKNMLYPWLGRKHRKKTKRPPRVSAAFPPEMVAYYRRRSQSRRELMQLWLEQFVDACDWAGIEIPEEILPPHSPLRQTYRAQSGYSHDPHPSGFRPHPPPNICPGHFEMEQVLDNAGRIMTSYTSCQLCGWSVNMTPEQVQAVQLGSRRYGYQGPVDGIPGPMLMKALQEKVARQYGYKYPSKYPSLRDALERNSRSGLRAEDL